MANQESLKRIAENFYRNIHALRIFNEQIGGIAEQHDETTLKEFFSGFSQVVGLPEEELDPHTGGKLVNVKIRIPKFEDLKHSESNQSEEQDESQDPAANITNIDYKDEHRDVVIDDLDKAIALLQFMESSRKKLPNQARLLRQGALINLVTFYEALIGRLLQYFYLSNPSALPSEGRLLSLSDLREIGSIENAEKF